MRLHRENIRDMLVFLFCAVFALTLFEKNDKFARKAIRKSENSENYKYCPNLTCRKESLRLFYNADRNVDRCRNFYRYTCGKFMSNIKSSDTQAFYQLAQLQENINKQLIKDLSEPILFNDTNSVKLIKTFYRKCNDESNNDKDASDEIHVYIEKLGGWPLLDNESSNVSISEKQLYSIVENLKLAKLEIALPFTIEKMSNSENDSMLYISPVRSLIKREIKGLTGIESITKTLSQTYHIAILLGGFRPIIASDLKRMYHLELEFIKQRDNSNPAESQMYLVKTLSSVFPGIDWTSLLRMLFGEKLTNEQAVLVENATLIKRISDVMLENPRVIANFLILNAVALWMDFLKRELRTAKKTEQALGEERSLRQEECLALMSDMVLLNAYYARKYVAGKKIKASAMFQMIKAQAEMDLKTISQRDEKAASGIKYLESMRATIGYPDFLINSEEIELLYNQITSYEEKSAFEIYIRIMRVDSETLLNLIKNKANGIDSIDDIKIAHTDARYHADLHKIMIPGGVLQIPYFDEERPMYLNFGALGYMIGREIVRGYKYRNEQLSDCLIKQFSDYLLLQINKKIDGNLTLEENYADNVGLKLAYNALKLWINEQEIGELPLTHFPSFTPRQMFWLGAASICCGYESDDVLELNILLGRPTPPVARVNVGFSTLIDFISDFECSVESNANPARHSCN